MAWPPRSLDLTTRDNSLWGILKKKIYQLLPTDLRDPKTAIMNSFYDI
jgi:hypothetical protein